MEARFRNGNKANGTIIVGADGAKSAVRHHLFDEDGMPNPLNLGYLNQTICYNDAEKALFVRKMHLVNSLAVHPDCAVLISAQDIPNPTEPADWRFQIAMNWNTVADNEMSNEGKHKLIRVLAKDICEVRGVSFDLGLPPNFACSHSIQLSNGYLRMSKSVSVH